MNYALIEGGMVTNIIWMHPNNAADFSNAVFFGDLPIEMGDVYQDGVFYRDGEIIVSHIDTLQRENADMYEALVLLGVE